MLILNFFICIDMKVDKWIDIDEEADNNCYLTDWEIIDIVTEREHEDMEEMPLSERVSSKEAIESVEKIKRF